MDAFRLLWLLSIWFMKSNSSITQFYHRIGNRRGIRVSLFRRYEKTAVKLSKKSLDKEFFVACQNLQICPEFLKFKPPKLKAYDDKIDLYHQVVTQQIRVIEHEMCDTKDKWRELKRKLFVKLSFFEKACLTKLLQRHLDKTMVLNQNKINAKLLRTWKKNKSASPDCLINLSSKTLDVYERNVLHLGLKHHVLPKKVNDLDVKIQIEKLMKSIVIEKDSQCSYGFRDKVKFEVNTFLKSCDRVCTRQHNKSFHRTIRKLASDPSISVCKFDKGNGVVILDRADYVQKCNEILSDDSKFEKLDSSKITEVIMKKRDSLRNYVYRYLRKNDAVDEDTYKSLYEVGANPGKFYGLVKVHKDGNPVRPVVSMIGTPEYGLAKWLDSYIKPNIPSTYMLSSTDNFVNLVKDFPVQSGDKLISFDVKSLFTNVPLVETIDIVTSYLYAEDSVITPPLPKKIFKKLLLLVTQGNFLFNGHFYRQKDGLAMGGPLGPTLSNFFVAHLEKVKMMSEETVSFRPKLYARYIDDIFAIFDGNQEYTQFFNYINSLHDNLEFTVEVATDSLPFLDVQVQLCDDHIDLNVYRKPTDTNVVLNFDAVAPDKWKSGLINCLLHRAWRVCSSSDLFNVEVEKLRSIFSKNGYPNAFFQKAYSSFCDRVAKLNGTPLLTIDEEPEHKHLIKLPFVGKASRTFAKRLKNLILRTFDIEIFVVYKSCKLSSFFSLKDATPLPLTSNIVYQYKCFRDENITYIGETTRPLKVRVDEHLAARNNKSAVGSHITRCDTCKRSKPDLNSFHIMKRCRTNGETRIMEALLIRRHAPKLNKQMFSKGASFILNVY